MTTPATTGSSAQTTATSATTATPPTTPATPGTTQISTTTAHLCDEPMGLSSGEMPNSFLSASSSAGPDNGPEQGRLDGPGAWRPEPEDTEPYFEVST